MRPRVFFFAFIATACALVAALAVRSFLDQRPAEKIVVEVPTETRTIVVADAALRYGQKLTSDVVREIEWPAEELPAGVFAAAADLFKTGKDRFVLSAMEPNEPVLAQKVTGPGQRASLSAIVSDGLRAITVRVNDVYGVAGFVLPGEVVDVLVTGEKDNKHFTDILVQNVRVLAVDQIADDRRTDPVVAKAVTLEVTARQSQKVALGASIGKIALALRPAGEMDLKATQRITLDDLGGSVAAAPRLAASAPAPTPGPAKTATVGIRRGMERMEYPVARSGLTN